MHEILESSQAASPYLTDSQFTSSLGSPSVTSSVPDFLYRSPDAVAAVIISFLDHKTRLSMPSRLTDNPMATRALDSELDLAFLNFVCCQASDAEFQRFLASVRPVHIKLNLLHFEDHERANTRVAEILRRASLGLRSLNLNGQWNYRVLGNVRERISDCRKYQLSNLVIDTGNPNIFPTAMLRLQELILDNIVLVCDRNFQLPLPTVSTLRRLHLAVRPATFSIHALHKLTALSLTLKFVTKKEHLEMTLGILKMKFPTILEIDSLVLCDLNFAEIPNLTSLTVGSAAFLDERILKYKTFPTGSLSRLSLRLQAPNDMLIRRFFRIFKPNEHLNALCVVWNSEEDFFEDLVALRISLARNFRFTVLTNGMGVEATREKTTSELRPSGSLSFSQEFGNLIKCKCLQCRLEENSEHTKLVLESTEIPEQALSFYQD